MHMRTAKHTAATNMIDAMHTTAKSTVCLEKMPIYYFKTKKTKWITVLFSLYKKNECKC